MQLNDASASFSRYTPHEKRVLLPFGCKEMSKQLLNSHKEQKKKHSCHCHKHLDSQLLELYQGLQSALSNATTQL
jgi:hypothetical protein